MEIVKVNADIFREYDIRGICEKDLTEDVMYTLGKGIATSLRKRNVSSCVLGYDNRESSPIFAKALSEGLLESGINVCSIGLVTSPMCYCATKILGINSSIMITASHNPKEFNGVKVSFNGEHNCFGEDIKEFYNNIITENFVSGNGKYEEKDIKNDYIEMVIKDIDLDRKLKVVYDSGNGTTSIVIKDILSKLNIETIGLYDESNGDFPNHHPDPSIEDNLTVLKQTVLKEKADLGVGYDGDGDRVGVVDEKGNFVEIDKIMIVIWRYLSKFDFKNKGALFDVKCSKSLEDELKKLNFEPVCYRTGNSHTRYKMYAEKYIYGGELSGHMYFQDRSFPGYDDGIYASLRIIEILSKENKPFSELYAGINKYYNTPEIKYPTSDDIKFEVVEKFMEYCKSRGYNILTIDGVKILYDDGFTLIRASNTTPNLTARYEAKTEERLKEMQSETEQIINEIKKEIIS